MEGQNDDYQRTLGVSGRKARRDQPGPTVMGIVSEVKKK